MSKIKIANVLTKKLFRSSLTACLSQVNDFQVSEEVGNLADSNKIIELNQIDIIILDTFSGGMLDVKYVEKLKKLSPNTQLMLIFNDEDVMYFQQIIQHGITGLIHSNCSIQELENCIRSLYKHHRYIAPEIANSLIFDQHQTGFTSLTHREIEILKMIVLDGLALVQIGEILKLSPKTITAHKANIMNKLASKNNVELIYQARAYFNNFGSHD